MKRSFIMPRRARLVMAGIAWHVIQRGNNRSACFYAEEDCWFYLDTLKEPAAKHGCAVHAYVLMTNHVHLLLTPSRVESVALMMKHLGQRYMQYVNRTYRRSGTLWEGRFKSCIAQDEHYVLACYRYIELNPLRAEMVKHPGEYRWSSYRANAYGEINELLVEHEQFTRLGCDEVERRENYRSLFAPQMDTELVNQITMATCGNYVLGDSRFAEEIERALGRRVLKGAAGRPTKKSACLKRGLSLIYDFPIFYDWGSAMKRIIVLLAATIFGSCFSAGAAAWQYVDSVTVVSVQARADNLVFINVSNPPSDTCRWYGEIFVFAINTDAGKAIYSNLLAGKAGGKKISVWYTPTTAAYGSNETSGCTDGNLATVKGIRQT